MSVNAPDGAPARKRWSRGTIISILVAVCFIPAAINTIAREFWHGLPGEVRWAAYGASGLMVVAIVWLIMTAEYADHANTASGELD